MGIIGFLVFGLIVGLLARLLLPGRQKIGLPLTLLLGVVGSLIGGLIATKIGSGSYTELNVVGAIAAVVASVALLAAAESAGLGRGKDRDRLEGSRR